LVSKSSFEPRGTGSRRSTTPSHGNMRLRPSSTETWKRVLLVPPTKILFLLFTELGYFRVLYASYYALLCFLCKLFSALEKKNRKKKEELSLLSESNSPRFALSIRRRRWLLLPWRNTTTTKKRARKKGKKLARASQNSPYSNPLCPFFRGVFSFICHFHNACFVLHLQEKKQTMKKRAPTLPPSIIDR